MPTKIRLGGAWIDPSGCQVFKSSAWRNVKQIQVYKGGAWRIVANFTAPGSGGGAGGGTGGSGGSLTLSISPDPLNKTGLTSSLTTANATATPTGGLSPYTYSWVKVSGDNISINSPTSALTKFTATGLNVDDVVSAVFRCTCTDSLGTTAQDTVTVTIQRAS